MEEIQAGCFQLEVRKGEPEMNMARVEETLPGLADKGCRLLVLPEMWSCGFAYRQLVPMAERTPRILETVSQWAGRYGMVLVGSLPELENGIVFNTSYVVDSSGEIVGRYRKIHLFTPSGENLHFGRGEAPLVCPTSVGKIGVMICYDLRFPELARCLALEGAQVLCVSALWPVARVEHWSLLLRSRAVENQMFVVGCNGSGVDGDLRYGGASALVSPTGGLLAFAGDGEERIMAELRPVEMTAFREHIPCLDDRLPEAYESLRRTGRTSSGRMPGDGRRGGGET